MSRLHICNTFFEQELAEKNAYSLKKWLTSNSLIEQLQYLPLLYAEKFDKILVSRLPPNPDPRLCTLENPPPLPIIAWGPSRSIATFAKNYSHPPIEVVSKIQAKSFSFQQSPMPGAALLYTLDEVKQWIEKTEGPKVLKKVLGLSGSGHFFVAQSPHLEKFVTEEFSQNRPILGEPWVKRILDFSSQWEIGDRIELKGVTLFETNERGVYRATISGPREKLFAAHQTAVDRHLEKGYELLQVIQSLGFFGPIGIDAFISEGNLLRPIVEVNARRTMSRVALDMSRDQVLRMTLEPNREGGLLPPCSKWNVFVNLV